MKKLRNNTLWQCSPELIDNNIFLIFAYSFVGIILISYSQLDMIQSLEMLIIGPERSGLARFHIIMAVNVVSPDACKIWHVYY